ncbi:uncharacterized protein [Argopecten irradians]|uniref:uncharacterized protein n=1 Tax=Argopecten irradians TaxID=31199 RepID=UPI00371B675A
MMDPGKEISHICPQNPNVLVTFPAGTVTAQESMLIQLEPVRRSKVPLAEVRGYTDTVYIQHDQAFLKPVQVKIPLTRIEEVEVDLTSCELLCVHFEEDEISIKEDIKVELLSGNICSFKTTQFSRNGVYAMKKTLRRSLKRIMQEIKRLHGMSPHIISVFIGKGYKQGTWRIHAEVLEQSDLQKTIEKRKKMDLMELPKCRSPSLTVVRVTKIKVSLSKDGPLALCRDYVKDDIAIEVIPGGEDQFTYFDIKKTNKDEEAKIIFNAKPSGKKLHTARFDPRDMNMGVICPDPASLVAGIAKAIPGTKSGTNMLTFSESKKEKINTTTTLSTVSPVGSERSETLTGFFCDSSMLILAKQIYVDDIRDFATYLKIPKSVFMDFKTKYSGSTKELKLAIMDHWLDNQPSLDKMAVDKLCKALKEIDLNRIAEIVKRVAGENRDLRRGDFEK